MSNELKTLPTGEVVLRNEGDFNQWVSEGEWCKFRSDHEPPASYPCAALAFVDNCDSASFSYTYLSDAEAMVQALKEAGAANIEPGDDDDVDDDTSHWHEGF